MKYLTIFLSSLLLFGCSNKELVLDKSGTTKTTIKISVPENTPDDDDIYIMGDFNNFVPNDKNSKTYKDGDYYYLDILGNNNEPLSFKVTRGSYDTVEKNINGNEVEFNNITLTDDSVITINVDSWKDLNEYSPNSTVKGHVELIEDMHMTQLDRTRDVVVYLPPDYHNNYDKRYPVLYMHDGQNLFNRMTAFMNEWGVDDNLEKYFNEYPDKGVIVVGIYNGGNLRMKEYLEDDKDGYVDFIVSDLKPFIDNTYRTLSDRENTAIAGSSLGGIISLYAGIEYQDVFSKIGAFSTSFWTGIVNDQQTYIDYLHSIDINSDIKLYMDAGEYEGSKDGDHSTMVNDMILIYDELLVSGHPKDNLKIVIDEAGRHNENSWRRRFLDAFIWLYE